MVAIAITILSTAVAANDLSSLLQSLPKAKFKEKIELVERIAASSDARVEPVLVALEDGKLFQVKKTQQIV